MELANNLKKDWETSTTTKVRKSVPQQRWTTEATPSAQSLQSLISAHSCCVCSCDSVQKTIQKYKAISVIQKQISICNQRHQAVSVMRNNKRCFNFELSYIHARTYARTLARAHTHMQAQSYMLTDYHEVRTSYILFWISGFKCLLAINAVCNESFSTQREREERKKRNRQTRIPRSAFSLAHPASNSYPRALCAANAPASYACAQWDSRNQLQDLVPAHERPAEEGHQRKELHAMEMDRIIAANVRSRIFHRYPEMMSHRYSEMQINADIRTNFLRPNVMPAWMHKSTNTLWIRRE